MFMEGCRLNTMLGFKVRTAPLLLLLLLWIELMTGAMSNKKTVPRVAPTHS
jgi:hypothetical protein